MFNVPILLTIFNRPNVSIRVIKAISKVRPTKIYIAADGPRTNNFHDELLCEKSRNSVLNSIKWKCEIKLLFRKNNLGCKLAVSDAISWFFRNESEGIILEDDCLPNVDFFFFCRTLLKKYRYDNRIFLISGNNFQTSNKNFNCYDNSYYFSRYANIWGWASWKRVISMYDVNISTFPYFKKEKIINNIFSNFIERFFWLTIFNNIFKKRRNTWDHQLQYLLFSQNGLSIIPRVNLVSNIGFGADSTRTNNVNSKLSNIKVEGLSKITHPAFITQNKDADKYMFKHLYFPMIIDQIGYHIVNFIRIILKLFYKS